MQSRTEKKVNLRIGLMGLVINNGNMGCLALTYSFISIMEKIKESIPGTDFLYYIFEDEPDKERIKELCLKLNIEEERIISKRYIRNFRQMMEFKKCDLIFDFTEGDSFSDIYGNKRFLKTFFYKQLALFSKTKYILGPQTLGPFTKTINRIMAMNIINRATCVFSRDKVSIDYIHQYTTKEIIQTTDVAFLLPYENLIIEEISNSKVGFNASKLLYYSEFDSTRIPLKTDFKIYAREVIKYLLSIGYKVYLFSHVSDDYVANKELFEEFPDTILVDKFSNPIDAKSFINTMDIIISPRMHATIGAYSSKTKVIAIAYSRKFRGLYSEIGLNNIIDLETKATDEAINITKNLIYYNSLEIMSDESNKKIQEFIDIFTKKIIKIIQE
jgi:polysaccharide pyruvyl transferase WcaK-like protein